MHDTSVPVSPQKAFAAENLAPECTFRNRPNAFSCASRLALWNWDL